MTKKTKPKLGWHAGGWVGKYELTPDFAAELVQEIPGIPTKHVEDAIAEYLMWTSNYQEKPTLAQRRANLDFLLESINQLLTLLGGKGIDQESRQHIEAHLYLAGHFDLSKRLKNDLDVLWHAALIEQRELDQKKGGRPINFPERMLADSVRHILEGSGIRVTTTKEGSFVKTLDIIFRAVGKPKEDAQSLARLVLTRKQTDHGRRKNSGQKGT